MICLLGACATLKPEPFQTRIYDGKYEGVWLAALKAVADYPLKLSNKDSGKIQSEVVNGPYNDLFLAVPEAIELPDRFRFSVRLAVAPLIEEGQSAVRVRVSKDLETFRDFYTGWVPYPSDGIEEKALLYRIAHILEMDNRLASTQ